MKWALRVVLGLYPSWWRRRYGLELEALVEDSRIGWSGVFDIARGAFVMRIRDFRTIPLLAALAGALIGAVISFRSPTLYASSSTVRISTGSIAYDALRYAVPADARATTLVAVTKSGGESSLVRISHTAQDAKRAQEVVNQLVAAALNDAGAQATVLEPPTLPTAPQRARGAGSVFFSAGLGLLLGGAFVVLRRAAGVSSAE